MLINIFIICFKLKPASSDHAGIATQLQVERLLASKGMSRDKIGRAKFEEDLRTAMTVTFDRYGLDLMQLNFTSFGGGHWFGRDPGCVLWRRLGPGGAA